MSTAYLKFRITLFPIFGRAYQASDVGYQSTQTFAGVAWLTPVPDHVIYDVGYINIFGGNYNPVSFQNNPVPYSGWSPTYLSFNQLMLKADAVDISYNPADVLPDDSFPLQTYSITDVYGETENFFYHSYVWRQVSSTNALFTGSADTVDFNHLTPDQIQAVQGGAPIYNSGGGDDTVYLPSTANASNLAGTGVSYDPGRPMVLGDGSDTVYGSDGLTSVTAGLGTDTINLSGVNSTVALSFAGTTGALLLVPKFVLAGTVSQFSAGNLLALPNQQGLTTFANGRELDAYAGRNLIAALTFTTLSDATALEPMNYSGGGTEIITDTSTTQLTHRTASTYTKASPGQIDWDFIDKNEGGNYDNPYVNGASMTVAIGVDLGTGITAAEFKSLFPSWSPDSRSSPYNANLAFLYNSIGHTGGTGLLDLNTGAVGQDAIGAIVSRSVSITTSQANTLTNWAQNSISTAMMAQFGAKFSSLPGGVATSLIDIAYNTGVAGEQEFDFYKDAKNLDLSSAATKAAGLIKIYEDMKYSSSTISKRLITDADMQVLPLLPSTYHFTARNTVAPSSTNGNSASFQFSTDTSTVYALGVPSHVTEPTTFSAVLAPTPSTLAPASSPTPAQAAAALAGTPSPAPLAFQLIEDTGSPLIASIILPNEGAAAFSVAYDQNGVTSQTATHQPGTTETLTGGADAITVTPLDAKGAPTAFDNTFTFRFNVSFASAGAFSGTIINPQSVGVPVYRFFDTTYGTHLFTQNLAEAQSILVARPDLTQETNGFGAVSPTSTSAEPVYRFFEQSNGTHFFTASQQEFLGLTTPGTSTYRGDLIYEPGSTFYENSTQQASDSPVYRLFDSLHGTQFLTSSQTEYIGLTAPSSANYRSDLVSEGIAFYAPQGSFLA